MMQLPVSNDQKGSAEQDPDAFDGKIAECKWHPSAKTFTPAENLKSRTQYTGSMGSME